MPISFGLHLQLTSHDNMAGKVIKIHIPNSYLAQGEQFINETDIYRPLGALRGGGLVSRHHLEQNQELCSSGKIENSRGICSVLNIYWLLLLLLRWIRS